MEPEEPDTPWWREAEPMKAPDLIHDLRVYKLMAAGQPVTTRWLFMKGEHAPQ
jgi:hypothetical protein